MDQPPAHALPDPLVPAISASVARLLAAADADIAAHNPVCRSSGRCCHFETWGHRLYVTSVELLHFAHLQSPAPASMQPANGAPLESPSPATSLPQFFARAVIEGCPYQSGTLCTARDARPLGCRIYFCDADAQSWQNDLYEKYHARLRALHDEFGVPYRYLEWRAALRLWADTSVGGIMRALLSRES